MITLVLSLLLTTTPPLAGQPGNAQEQQEPLALTIAGKPITAHEYTRWLVRFRGESMALGFVETWLLEKEAERLGIEIADEVIIQHGMDIQNARIQNAFNGDRASWLKEIARERLTLLGTTLKLEQLLRKEQLGTEILKRERRITEDALRSAWYYKYGIGGHTIDARVIEIEVEVPPAPPAATLSMLQTAREESIARAKTTAAHVRSEIVATKDFSKLARKYSAHESARRGGAPLNGFIPGDYSYDITDALGKLPAGELSQPIFGMGSWWIFQIDDVRKTPFKSVEAELREAILNQPPSPDEFSALYQALVVSADWEVLPTMWAHALGSISGDDVVLRIGDAGITRNEYSKWLRVEEGENMAKRYVDAWVIERKAQELKIKLTDDEIFRRIEMEKQRLFSESSEPTREAWIAAMPGGIRTEESMTRDMLISHISVFLAEEIYKSKRVISEAEIRYTWEDLYGAGGKARDARMIRIQVAEQNLPRGSSDEEHEALQKVYQEKLIIADQVKERLDNGEDFGAVARKYSDHESKDRGGEFPDGFKSAQWNSIVEEAFNKLDVGGITDVLQIGTNLYIFELLDFRHTPLEDVREEIEAMLNNARPTVPQLAETRNVLVRDVEFTIEPNLVR